MSSSSERTESFFSQLIRMTILSVSCIVGAWLVIVVAKTRPQFPWTVYVFCGMLGGVLGYQVGLRMYCARSNKPTQLLSNFEYRKLVRKLKIQQIAENCLACIVGGVVGVFVLAMAT